MIHLGDITKIRGCAAPVVDVFIGGSPCQDLSIAGKRAGFGGTRSVLCLEEIRIIEEMRHCDRARGRTGEFIRPRFMVWENVPGAFSSNGGKDFQAVLTAAIRVAEPEAPPVPMPPKGWPTAGCLMGDGWSVAWRVLDAQFWGVPQRRRRIALVADFGGHAAPEILFVREGLSGDTQPGGKAGEAAAGGTGGGAAYAVRTRCGCDGGGKGALVQEEKSGALTAGNDQIIFCVPINDKATRYAGGGSSRHGDGSGNGLGIGKDGDPAPTLTAGDRHGVFFCAGFKLGASASAKTIGYTEELAPTLNAECGGNKAAVAVFDPAQITSPVNRSQPGPGKPCCTLTSRMGTGGNNVPVVFRAVNFANYCQDEISATCKRRDWKDGQNNLVCAVDCRNRTENPQTNGTLQAKSAGGQSLNLNNVIRAHMTVRRLTPLECERLQGFPDGWTDIGNWVDGNGRTRKTTDSARYKALGNSIALPPWKWVLKRLCAQYERDATMASLFDGIGGFPLIWEQLNGKGSCVWASEIEEFPIAVTSKRFGGAV